jgi:lipopolysaccharide cholinephosphotransferase
MEISNEQIREIQLVQLDILREFQRVCIKHELHFFLDSGTTLGAVRHKGFIPWDDDLDVGMIRKDYNKFIETSKKELFDDYELLDYSTNHQSPFLHCRIIKRNTTLKRYSYGHLEISHGIYIDIFPYDNAPNNRLVRFTYLWKRKLLYWLFVLKHFKGKQYSKKLKMISKLFIILRRASYIILKIFPKQLIRKMTEQLFVKYNDNNTDYLTVLAIKKRYEFKKSDIFPTFSMQFEGEFFPIPNNYHDYLTKKYGNYMELPPENKRVPHSIIEYKS